MFIRRAKEIVQSNDTIEVLYKNEPIWIEHVYSETETAYIRSLNNDKRMEVPILDLVENENI
ncbi:H-type small acid-soluble spore protein [Tepidibacter formicigenes]|jgi:small acid-soluble spore protein H (minor)|uniref:Small acid-soluble spore protein H family protein n=1 Tax=Tepidibacter formicigenes DSM 15518 TaxID=1123349 RepID=A0A1M6PNR4_9FIRM|nr:H-type small acid-soluble spore protein [Tepidibacter formicigenes]SHK09592.1 Small acid-soluble spore protein H family protein [Tepidibacter formicigenes DSM 15518]